ncbi:acyl transferase [Robiginitalea sp. M366]|uniref:acyl transferase n=1 Tax=Robiginitalea aestuariiviva TaxID=3036903 RepID=UPI00240E04AB|nr:acyl transferase [Robiginitalea aestuariiviva]MDG1571770.1 acyl transferase [Robiginitalea aestuariiviva]
MEEFPFFEIDTPAAFQEAALETFAFQFAHVPLYRTFCEHLGRHPGNVRTLSDLPFLPISFFKTHTLLAKGNASKLVFQSSGTTGSVRSQHHVADPERYRQSFLYAFKRFYGPPSDHSILALLPSYQQQPGSSLIYMVDALMQESAHPLGGYLTGNPEELAARIIQADREAGRTLLIGVSYALLDLARSHPMNLRNTTIMETGGMKGRGREMVREALHAELSKGFGQPRIHSEYGMTELLSQAYSSGNGLFRCPPWMQVRIRDTEDPLSEWPHGRTGGVNVIDLANRYSCAFIATQDLGKTHTDGTFEILGRFDHSDIRGCNLLML